MLFVAIVLIGFTWRLIRRLIVKSLHLVFNLTGLTSLYEQATTRRHVRRGQLKQSWFCLPQPLDKDTHT